MTDQWRWWESKATVPRFEPREEPKVKTVRWTVFKESVEEVYDYKHTATSGVGVICTVKHTPARLKINGRDSKATVPRNFRFYFAMII